MELGVDLLLLPEEGLQVLHPFEIRHDHAARVGDDVRDQEDVSVMKDGVGLRGDGRVRSLGDESRSNPACVVLGDLILHGRRDENRHGQLDNLFVGDVVGLLEAGDPAADLPVLFQGREVQTAWVVHAALGIADGHHFEPGLGEQPSRRPADLAITLHCDGRSLLVDM